MPQLDQPSIKFIEVGQGCSIQDLGRLGHLRNGVSPSGPMDYFHFMQAWMLCNPSFKSPLAPISIEIGIGGITIEAQGANFDLAISGIDPIVHVNGKHWIAPLTLRLMAGERIEIKSGKGLWAYLSIAGVPEIQPLLGSFSSHSRNELVAMPLISGMEINWQPINSYPDTSIKIMQYPNLYSNLDHCFYLLKGPQYDVYPSAALDAFLDQDFTIGSRQDRMAYQILPQNDRSRLPKLADIPSESTMQGAMQITGDGIPYILMADRQPTGGYPKPAVVCRADLYPLAQLAVGEIIRFAWIDLETSQIRWHKHRIALKESLQAKHNHHSSLNSDLLLGENLISGVFATDY